MAEAAATLRTHAYLDAKDVGQAAHDVKQQEAKEKAALKKADLEERVAASKRKADAERLLRETETEKENADADADVAEQEGEEGGVLGELETDKESADAGVGAVDEETENAEYAAVEPEIHEPQMHAEL
jgi:hypothetical protein